MDKNIAAAVATEDERGSPAHVVWIAKINGDLAGPIQDNDIVVARESRNDCPADRTTSSGYYRYTTGLACIDRHQVALLSPSGSSPPDSGQPEAEVSRDGTASPAARPRLLLTITDSRR